MEIGINKGYKKAEFKDVEIGQCFIYKNSLYMKIQIFFGDDTYIRAIKVMTGEGTIFSANESVDLIECSIVVER